MAVQPIMIGQARMMSNPSSPDIWRRTWICFSERSLTSETSPQGRSLKMCWDVLRFLSQSNCTSYRTNRQTDWSVQSKGSEDDGDGDKCTLKHALSSRTEKYLNEAQKRWCSVWRCIIKIAETLSLLTVVYLLRYLKRASGQIAPRLRWCWYCCWCCCRSLDTVTSW